MNDEPEIVMGAMLGASLALVRPVGMSPKETSEWIDVAIDTLSHLPLPVFEAGVRAARTKCTHHSQIVPTIVAETRDALAWHNRLRTEPVLRLVGPEQAAPREAEPLPDPATLMPALRRMGLERGWIVDRDGKLEWAEGNAA